MAKALAIETSGRIGSVAAVENGNVLSEQEFPHGLKHAAGILPIIDGLCQEQGWRPGDLGEVYVSIGPGSFTGLRIGVTLAKTLAFARGVRIVAVPSVRVLVENAPDEARNVIIVLDAKREQIFTARFERESEEWIEREAAHLDSLTGMIERAPRPVYLLGEGIPYHRKFIPDEAGVIVTPESAWRARAGVVARLGTQMARRGEYADPLTLAPIYIRLAEAEEKWNKEHPAGI